MPPFKAVYPKPSNCGICDLKQYGDVPTSVNVQDGIMGFGSQLILVHSQPQSEELWFPSHGPDPGSLREAAVPMGGWAVLMGRQWAALGAQAALWLQPLLCDSSLGDNTTAAVPQEMAGSALQQHHPGTWAALPQH